MDSLTNQCKRISTRLLPPGLVFSTEGRTKGGWAGLRPELAWLVRAETPARRRSDGRLPASREVLTAADRRQINYASGRYSADVCISRSHPGDGHVRASLLVLRFGRPFVVFSPSASETLSCWRPQSFCDPPTSPLCFVWGGVSPAESCVRGAPLCEYSLHTSRTRSTREGRARQRGLDIRTPPSGVGDEMKCCPSARKGIGHTGDGLSQEVVENDLQTDPENHLHPAPPQHPYYHSLPPHSDE